MPIHDWTRVGAGAYHDFHQDWMIEIRRALNGGILPSGYFALAEQRVSGPEPDAITMQSRGPWPPGGLAVAETPPRMKSAARAETESARYARKADRIAFRQGLGRVVAIIEIVSPGNKDSRHAFASFVGKAVEFLRAGVHFLMIDLFPPGPRDPDGLARAIWDELDGGPFEDRPAGRPLTVAAFDAGEPTTAYVEAMAVGDPMPEAPLFLEPGWYVNVPLEPLYRASHGMLPAPIRELVEGPGASGG